MNAKKEAPPGALEALVLKTARAAPTPISRAAFSSLLEFKATSSAVDPLRRGDWIHHKIEQLGLEPLFYTLARGTKHPVAVRLAARCKPAWQKASLSDMVRESFTARLGDALHEASIPYIPLKGMDLRERVYRYPETRTMCDVDVLVKNEHHARAESIIVSRFNASRRPWVTHPGRWEDTYYNSHLDIPAGESSFLVELHRGFGHRWHVTPDYPAVWQRALMTNSPAKHVLTPEDTLLLAVYHLSRSLMAMSPKWLLDLEGIVSALRPQWDIVISRARRWGCLTALWFFLDRGQATLGEDFAPAWVLKTAQPALTRSTYLDSLLPKHLTTPPLKSLPPRVFQALTLFPLMDDWRRRGLFLTHYTKLRLMDLMGR